MGSVYLRPSGAMANIRTSGNSPGGKVEPGESPRQALVREIREELEAEIAVGDLLATVEYDYPAFHLHMDCFFATVAEGDLVLKEHEAARWLLPEELDSVPWLPADRSVIPLLSKEDTKCFGK